MGCNVVQRYLEKHPAPAAVLMAPSTPRGIRRITLHMVRRHPRIVLRANTSGSTADLFNIAGPQQHGPGDDSDADDHQESDDNPGGHRSQRCGTATQGVRVPIFSKSNINRRCPISTKPLSWNRGRRSCIWSVGWCSKN